MTSELSKYSRDPRLPDYCTRNAITRLRIFGSRVKGNEKPNSDLDVLVDFEHTKRVTLLDLARIERELSQLLSIRIDLRTEREISRYFRDEVNSQAVTLYAA